MSKRIDEAENSGLSRRGLLRGGLLASVGFGLRARAAEPSADPPASPPSKDPPLVAPAQASAGPQVSLRVNGDAVSFAPKEDELLIDTLRERLGLTGSKRGCGHGACGACTVLLDGAPVVSCLLPTETLGGRAVRSVEGLGAGAPDGLHPVQRAILAQDALQCGFCTPGFVASGVALYEATRGGPPPGVEAVADALEGNLCRCGAHPRLLAAIQAACAGAHEAPLAAPHQHPRVDGVEKVRGEAKYTVDVAPEGLAHGAVLRAAVAHGRLRSIDLSAAAALPGVVGVVALHKAGDTVRYHGQELAAVAAEDLATARAALRLIRVEVDPLPAVFGVDAALASGAALVYADAAAVRAEGPPASEGPLLGATLEGNLRGPTSSSMLARPRAGRRRLAEAVGGAGTAVELTAESAVISHTTMEPHAAVARWADGGLEVWASTQSCVMLAEDLAERFELPVSAVVVRCPYVGGGFGGKVGLSIEVTIAALLAQASGRPVRVALSRSEELAVGGCRPGQRIAVGLGADADGALAGMTWEAQADSGVSVGVNTAMMARLSYRSPFKDLVDYDVLSHQAPSKPMRAPGGPAAFFALEQAVDALAVRRGEDPVALRRRWDENPPRLRLYDWAEGIPAWRDRAAAAGADKGRFRRGIGLAAGTWFGFVDPSAQVRIDAGADGIVVSTAAQDMGNGTRTVLAEAVAGVLGLSPHAVTVRLGDSRDVYGPMSAGSRTTASLRPPAVSAAEELVRLLLSEAEDRLGLRGAVAEAGGLRAAGRAMTWAELLTKIPSITVIQKRRRDPAGYFMPVTIEHSLLYNRLPGVVQLMEVEVDARLGRVRALRSWTGLGVGHIHVPAMARTQVEGGVVQGVSAALYEERRSDPRTGRVLSDGLESYRLAGVGDVPEQEIHFDPVPFEGLIGGGMGLSELATVAVTPSIANAVYHATRWRPLAVPLRNDRVLAGLAAVEGA
jgi:xanthine dehydrogenase YagR molybdenum-binding subunit